MAVIVHSAQEPQVRDVWLWMCTGKGDLERKGVRSPLYPAFRRQQSKWQLSLTEKSFPGRVRARAAGRRCDWSASCHVTGATSWRPAPIPGARSAAAAGPHAHFHFSHWRFTAERWRVFFFSFLSGFWGTKGRHSKEIRVALAYGGGLLSGKEGGWETGVSRFTRVKLSLQIYRRAKNAIKSRKQSSRCFTFSAVTW